MTSIITNIFLTLLFGPLNKTLFNHSTYKVFAHLGNASLNPLQNF